MIKLTSYLSKKDFWVNPNYIVSVGVDDEGDVYVVINGVQTFVTQTVEEILFKMGVSV